MKVLIADDEFQIRTGLQEGLDWKGLGFEATFTAANGIEALALFKEHRPELVITDIRMPGMDGLELAGAIRELSQATPIIILSGHSEFDYAKRALRLGVTDYLLKPVRMKELLELIGEVRRKILSAAIPETVEVEYEPIKAAVEACDYPAVESLVAGYFIRARALLSATAALPEPATSGTTSPAERLASDLISCLARVLEENGFDAEALITEGRPSGTTDDAGRRVLDTYRSVIEEYAGLNGIRHAPAMARALDHLRKNLDRDLTADDLAAFLQKSPNYFSHLFKKEFGVSFSEYLNRARIREAKRLMRTSNLLAYEIAERIGYRDYRYFVEVFKKQEGCPPSEYRKS